MISSFPNQEPDLQSHQLAARILRQSVERLDEILQGNAWDATDCAEFKTLSDWIPFSFIATLAATIFDEEA